MCRLSSSALVNAKYGFGTARLLGFVSPDTDVPHFALEHVVQGDKVRMGAVESRCSLKQQCSEIGPCPTFARVPQMQGTITLWPRQGYTTDLEYLHRYFTSGTMV